MDNRLVRFTKWLLDVMFYMGSLLTVVIPWLFRFFGRYIESFHKYYLIQCFMYMASGILCLKIVYELRKMFCTVLNEDAFVMDNARSLKIMGKCSFGAAVLSLIRLPFSPTPATFVIIIVFTIAGLFSTVLCQVFEKAVQYKQKMI